MRNFTSTKHTLNFNISLLQYSMLFLNSDKFDKKSTDFFIKDLYGNFGGKSSKGIQLRIRKSKSKEKSMTYIRVREFLIANKVVFSFKKT